MRPEEEQNQIEKLESEIANLKTRIKNTEYDLANMFRGNGMVQNKLENTKKILVEKQNLIERLRAENPAKAGKFKEFEEKVIEKNETSISLGQEKIIEDEIEKEFD